MSNRKIYIEGTPLFSNSRSGVGQYVKRLTEALQRIHPEDSYTVFGFHFFAKGKVVPSTDIAPEFKQKYIRWLPGRAYNLLYKKHLRIPIDLLLGAKPDVVFYGNFAYWPLVFGSKSIVVVHDLGFIDVPEYVEKKNRKFLAGHTKYSVSHATHIVTVSEHAKRRIMQHYQVPDERITIIYPAVDHSEYYPQPKPKVEEVREKFKLPDSYFLFVGTLEPRKNLVGLLDAYAALDPKLQQQYPLVLVGGRGWADDEIQERLKKYSHLPIIRPGYIPDAYMPALYTGARALLWPSYYEGFGMPPLEAMACGTPVLTSHTTSLPEVVGDAALLVDPANHEEIVQQITMLANDNSLHQELTNKGLVRSQLFTWDKSAQDLYGIIARL